MSQVSGLGGSSNWQPWVDQMVDQVYSARKNQLKVDKAGLDRQVSSLGDFKTKLDELKGLSRDLQSEEIFYNRKTALGNPDSLILRADASPKTEIGRFDVSVTQLATASKLSGAVDVGAALDVSDVTTISGNTGPLLSAMNLTAEVKAGFFTVNGVQVTVATTDTLQDVFNAIKTATGGDIEAQYSSATDKVTFTSQGGNDIVLGSAADSSNFLALMRLYSGGTGVSSVVSTHKLGVVNINTSIANSGLAAEGSIASSGSFTINGEVISFDKTTDSIRTIIERVENSASGVRLVYDKLEDQFHFENKETGNLGFTIDDTSGGFLAALSLVGGGAITTLGDNAAFSINGGASITSTSNNFDASSHGIEGLTIKAQSVGVETVEVIPDPQGVREKIDAFVEKFNDIQTFVTTQTKITVGTNGKSTKGPLGGNKEVRAIGDNLRTSVFNVTNASSSTVVRLMDLGIDFSTTGGKLTVSSESTLSSMLADNPNDVASYFATTDTGLGATVESLVDQYTKNEGIIDSQQELLKSRILGIENDINSEERMIKAQRASLEKSFLKMDQTQAQMQTQNQALLKMFE